MSETKTPAKDPRIVILKNVRLSYPQLFRAKGSKDKPEEKKFGAAFLLDKVVNAADIESVKKACLYIKTEDGKGKPVGSDRVCLRDGAEKSDKEGYGEGVMFVTARSDTRPGIVGRDGRTPLAEEDGILYAGCYVNASIRLWWQDNQFGKRINASLMNVQFVRKGEPFGESKVAPEEQFENLGEEDGSAAPASSGASEVKPGKSWI